MQEGMIQVAAWKQLAAQYPSFPKESVENIEK
jgi:hypothetical protein